MNITARPAATCAATPVRPLHAQIHRANEITSQLHAQLDELEDQLNVVLEPQPAPKPSDAIPSNGVVCRSAVVDEVRSITDRIETACARISSIRERLHV